MALYRQMGQWSLDLTTTPDPSEERGAPWLPAASAPIPYAPGFTAADVAVTPEVRAPPSSPPWLLLGGLGLLGYLAWK